MTCCICNSLEANTWFCILLSSRQSHVHAFRTKRHNKVVRALIKLIVLSKHCKCYILVNTTTFNNKPLENTVLPWLLPCTCKLQNCPCYGRFHSDIICIKGLPYLMNPPTTHVKNLPIQFTECTCSNDRFSLGTIIGKTEKYQPLTDNITNKGWNVKLLIVTTTSATATTLNPSMKILEKKFKIQEQTIRQTFTECNTIAIEHPMSIIL